MRSRRVQDRHCSRAMDGLPHSGPTPFGRLPDRQTLHPVESRVRGEAKGDASAFTHFVIRPGRKGRRHLGALPCGADPAA